MVVYYFVLWIGRLKVKGDRYFIVMLWDFVFVIIKIYRMVKIRNIFIDIRFFLKRNIIFIFLKFFILFVRN